MGKVERERGIIQTKKEGPPSPIKERGFQIGGPSLHNVRTMAELVQHRARETSDLPYFLYRPMPEQKFVPETYGEFYQHVREVALGILAMKRDLRAGDDFKVAIISPNRPEWLYVDFASISLGIVNVPIHATSEPPNIAFQIANTGCQAAFISIYQLYKLRQIKAEIPTLKRIIIFDLYQEEQSLLREILHYVGATNVSTLTRLIEEGKQYPNPEEVEEAASRINPDTPLTVMHTAGTTGNPKGVVLTHGNLIANRRSTAEVWPTGPGDLGLSIWPFSHSYERSAGAYAAMYSGYCNAICDGPMKDQILANAQELRCTILNLVPGIVMDLWKDFKNLFAGQETKFEKAMEIGKRVARHWLASEPIDSGLLESYKWAQYEVFSKLYDLIGGPKNYMMTAGAPLPKEYFVNLAAAGIYLLQGYGLTETSPALTLTTKQDLINFDAFDTVGRPIPEVEVKLTPNGEVLGRGPNVMPYYYNSPEATQKAFRSGDGWFHTNDLGEFVEINGKEYLRIITRVDDMLITSYGENVPAPEIENRLISDPHIKRACLVAANQKFVSALIVPRETLEGHLKEDNITKEDYFVQAISVINSTLESAHKIRKIALVDDFKPEEITPKNTVKRSVIYQNYKNVIDQIYGDKAKRFFLDCRSQ